MKLDKDYKTDLGNGTSTCPGYTVEARHRGTPAEVGGQIFDGEWRRVSYEKTQVGVPNSSLQKVEEHGLLGYATAQALRWWLHASSQADFGSSGFCLDTRIIKHNIKTTHAITAVSMHEFIGGEDNPNFQPSKEEDSE